MHKYKVLEALGEGTFAVVHKAKTADGATVAIKRIKEKVRPRASPLPRQRRRRPRAPPRSRSNGRGRRA
jgi:serine/threonine protein kinase